MRVPPAGEPGRPWCCRPGPSPGSGARGADAGLVGLHLAGALELLEAPLLLDVAVRLADVLEEPVGARVVLGRLVLVLIGEDEVVVEKLLPLLHLALEHGAQVRLLADDVRRQDQDEVRLLERRLRERKSAPSTGMSPRSGIFVSVRATRLRTRPPMTTVCWSFTTSCVCRRALGERDGAERADAAAGPSRR